jgi:plastocyanin
MSTNNHSTPRSVPRRRRFAIPALIVFLVAVIGTFTVTSAPSSAQVAETHHVDIMGFAYMPAELTIEAGDTVTWHNHDSAPHTVTVSDGPVTFNSGNLAQGQTYSYTFSAEGLYEYYCAVHPSMTASVTVAGDGTTPPDEPDCIPATIVDRIWAHVTSAHLQPSVVEQIQALLDTDSYVQAHTVWLQSILEPVVEGGPELLAQTVDLIMAHVESAHLQTPLLQQLADLLQIDSYILFHTSWLNNVLQPALDQASCT